MGANTTQGLAILAFLVAFTFLAAGFFNGNLLFIVLFAVAAAASIALFLKCKPWEHMQK